MEQRERNEGTVEVGLAAEQKAHESDRHGEGRQPELACAGLGQRQEGWPGLSSLLTPPMSQDPGWRTTPTCELGPWEFAAPVYTLLARTFRVTSLPLCSCPQGCLLGVSVARLGHSARAGISHSNHHTSWRPNSSSCGSGCVP